MGKTKIRPCEYCGGAGRLIQIRILSNHKSRYKVFCDKCERYTRFCGNAGKAINAWDRAMEFVAKMKNPDFCKEADRKFAEERTEWE